MYACIIMKKLIVWPDKPATPEKQCFELCSFCVHYACTCILYLSNPIQHACGFEYVARLQRMVVDMRLSEDCMSAFQDHLHLSCTLLPLTFSTLVLQVRREGGREGEREGGREGVYGCLPGSSDPLLHTSIILQVRVQV